MKSILARVSTAVLAIVLSFSSHAWAGTDEVILNDGSRIKGDLIGVANDKVKIKTDFAGEVAVDTVKVKGISTEQNRAIETKGGERVIGPIKYDEAAGGMNVGGKSVKFDQVAGVWTPGEDSPEVKAMKDKVAKTEGIWTLRLELGLNGQTGNSEQFAFNGRVEAKRTGENDRFTIYAAGKYNHDNGKDTARQILGGADLEVDLDAAKRWFAWGGVELEHNVIEDLDLRTSVAGGIGYFFIREKETELKVRAGPGFQYEAYGDGTNRQQAIAVARVDFRHDFDDWLRFTHNTTYYPTFDDIADYRIVMENAVEVPLRADWHMKLKAGIRNQYKSQPIEDDIKRLDTFYFLNLVWELK